MAGIYRSSRTEPVEKAPGPIYSNCEPSMGIPINDMFVQEKKA